MHVWDYPPGEYTQKKNDTPSAAISCQNLLSSSLKGPSPIHSGRLTDPRQVSIRSGMLTDALQVLASWATLLSILVLSRRVLLLSPQVMSGRQDFTAFLPILQVLHSSLPPPGWSWRLVGNVCKCPS